MTKTEKEKCMKTILNSYKAGEVLNPTHFEYVYGMLENHPKYLEKIGCGIKNIKVDKSSFNTNCFYIVRIDGTTEGFSVKECITPKNNKQKAMNAFRNEVFFQTDKVKKQFFNDGLEKECPITGEIITIKNAHVDHTKPITFEKLFDFFIEENNINVFGLEYNNIDNVRTLVDRKLADKWSSFHFKNAKLRVVSKKANLSNLRKG